MKDLFLYLFETDAAALSVGKFLLCLAVGFVVGLFYYFAYSYQNKGSKSFRAALILLPAIVAVVIMMVNGSIGVGVAIAGAFSLVRFRSAQGSAKEIAVIFMAMCSGLIVGVGYLAYALLFTIVMCLVLLAIHLVSAKMEDRDGARVLKVSIPENLDYEGVFDDLFTDYTLSHKSTHVRTANMGSIFKLTYDVTLKPGVSEKSFLDAIRVRNGNLEVSLQRHAEAENEL